MRRGVRRAKDRRSAGCRGVGLPQDARMVPPEHNGSHQEILLDFSPGMRAGGRGEVCVQESDGLHIITPASLKETPNYSVKSRSEVTRMAAETR